MATRAGADGTRVRAGFSRAKPEPRRVVDRVGRDVRSPSSRLHGGAARASGCGGGSYACRSSTMDGVGPATESRDCVSVRIGDGLVLRPRGSPHVEFGRLATLAHLCRPVEVVHARRQVGPECFLQFSGFRWRSTIRVYCCDGIVLARRDGSRSSKKSEREEIMNQR